MREMNFGQHTEYSFWGNVEFSDNKQALAARNKLARELRSQGRKVLCYTLTGQMRKYSSLGQPCGTIGNVYKLQVDNEDHRIVDFKKQIRSELGVEAQCPACGHNDFEIDYAVSVIVCAKCQKFLETV